MKLVRSGFLAYSLSILAIIVLIILLTVTLFRLSDIQRAMRNNANANMVWVLYQTHIESLMLEDVVQHQLIEPSVNNEFSHRYQMLISRISVLNDGPQKTALDSIGMADTIAQQSEAVLELAAKFHANETSSKDYKLLRETLSTLNKSLLTASNRSMISQWEEAGARIDKYRNAVLRIIFLMIGIWIVSVVICIQLIFALKKTRDNERSKQRELDLRKQLENERKISELYRSFGSMVSHQFRTPLSIIDATLQRLIRASDRMDATEIQQRASKAREATRRLTNLIERILHADRFMEQLNVNMKQAGLAHIAQQAVAEQKFLVPNRKIHFQDETLGESTVWCDPMLSIQIISNLLSNAIKYSDEHQTISVRVYREKALICCGVIDEGRGIRDEEMPHIFTRYFRAKEATDIVGTGIGLHIATELATLQQGKISAHSELGVGSTFVFCLPNKKTNGK